MKIDAVIFKFDAFRLAEISEWKFESLLSLALSTHE